MTQNTNDATTRDLEPAARGYGTFGNRKYVMVNDLPNTSSHSTAAILLTRPLLTPLIFPNKSSDARDHCANERNFLSWLRLSIYLAVVSVAILTQFHFTSEPTWLEKKVAFPLGCLFWVLSLVSLATGLGNYLITVRKYCFDVAVVQSGWRTQLVYHSSWILFYSRWVFGLRFC